MTEDFSTEYVFQLFFVPEDELVQVLKFYRTRLFIGYIKRVTL